MEVRYKQLLANFPLDREFITPFGGKWDVIMCRVENLFKKISNRSLAAKHALWKGDLWLSDDLINDNYFTALDTRAEIEADRFAVHSVSNTYAYRDKRQSASSNASSVIADPTYTTAKQTKARNDFYVKSNDWDHRVWRRIKLELVELGVRPVFFLEFVPTYQWPTQPAHFHENGRGSGIGSADY
jgi:hypothetical protein